MNRKVSLFLRRSDNKKWLPLENGLWLQEGDICADPVGELATKNNTLSLYEVEDDRANLTRIIAAMAATRNDFQHFQYSLVDRNLIEELNIKLVKIPGDTPDDIVNNYHYDLIEISGSKLISLAKKMLSNAERAEMLKSKVIQQIHNSYNGGLFSRMNRVSDKIRKALEKSYVNCANCALHCPAR
jgi:hypothetical protein